MFLGLSNDPSAELRVAPGLATPDDRAQQPSGMTELLTDIGSRYPDLPLMVTENGAAFYDTVSGDGAVHDADRVSYLHDHIDAVGKAIDAGADVRGYFLWSLLDNFEWSFGYDRRFGIIRVDFHTQQRTLKDSALWYAELIRSRQLPAVTAIPMEVDAG